MPPRNSSSLTRPTLTPAMRMGAPDCNPPGFWKLTYTVKVGCRLSPPMTTTKPASRPSATRIRKPTLTSIDRWLISRSRFHRPFGAPVDELLDHAVRTLAKITRSTHELHLSFVQHDDAVGDAED